MKEFSDKIIEMGLSYGGKLLLAILTFVVGQMIIKMAKKMMSKLETTSKLDETLLVIIKNVVTAVLYVILIISIIEILGVPMTSVMTLIASCGLAIGLSLQGALANLAGGLMILVFKPFKVNDYIEANGQEGTVKDISIFYTKLLTMDNKTVNIPNGDLMNSSITNYTGEELRRVDFDFRITNDCDLQQAIKVLHKAASKTKGVKKDPATFTRLSAMEDDTYVVTVRVWCDATEYWDVYFDTLENCSKALSENGIDDPEERIAVRLVK